MTNGPPNLHELLDFTEIGHMCSLFTRLQEDDRLNPPKKRQRVRSGPFLATRPVGIPPLCPFDIYGEGPLFEDEPAWGPGFFTGSIKGVQGDCRPKFHLSDPIHFFKPFEGPFGPIF